VDVDLSQASVAAPPVPSRITASNVQLNREGDSTVATMYLASDAAVGPYVAVQAVLTDRTGERLVAIVSGRFYCLFPGERLGVRMQLFHPVPVGTGIRQVSVFPIPRDLATVTAALPSCVAD
jgi:hypothetical protein